MTAERGSAVAFPDRFPVSDGHTLVVPRRHEAGLAGLSGQEQVELWALTLAMSERLRDEHECDGINIGLNLGEAAGQTVEHVHVHVIPRHRGDVDDPRGGVRWVLPRKAPYWR